MFPNCSFGNRKGWDHTQKMAFWNKFPFMLSGHGLGIWIIFKGTFQNKGSVHPKGKTKSATSGWIGRCAGKQHSFAQRHALWLLFSIGTKHKYIDWSKIPKNEFS